MSFSQSWEATILPSPPLIAPARQFTYPQQIVGEEDTLARGALLLMVKPAQGASFLATCVRGFQSASLPTGIFATPNPQQMCAVAGGYAYLVDTFAPERCTQIPLKPVVAVHTAETPRLLLFVGFHSIAAWREDGLAWQSARLSWEGIRVTSIEGNTLTGFGWEMMTDRELEFQLDLKTGQHTGGIR